MLGGGGGPTEREDRGDDECNTPGGGGEEPASRQLAGGDPDTGMHAKLLKENLSQSRKCIKEDHETLATTHDTAHLKSCSKVATP